MSTAIISLGIGQGPAGQLQESVGQKVQGDFKELKKNTQVRLLKSTDQMYPFTDHTDKITIIKLI